MNKSMKIGLCSAAAAIAVLTLVFFLLGGPKQIRRTYDEEEIDTITDIMIDYAESKLGHGEYAGRCLSFIEEALEKGNGVLIFGGDSAKASCEMYADALEKGVPERGAFVFYDCMCPDDDGRPVNWGHCGIALEDGQVIHAWDTVRVDDYLAIEELTALSGDHPKYLGWVPIERVLAQKWHG